MHAFFSLLYSCSFYTEYDLVPQDRYAFSLLGKYIMASSHESECSY